MSNKWCDSIVKHESTETGVLSSSSKLLIVLFFILLILIFSFVTYPIQILLFADTGKTVTTHMNCTVLSNEIPKITAKDKEGVTLCVIIDVSEVKKNLWYNRNTYNH